MVSAEHQDFHAHLSGQVQLRRARKYRTVVSESTRQFDEISAFDTLMLRSLTFDAYPESFLSTSKLLRWTDPAIASAGCYQYQYGIPPEIASAIQEVCRLSELITLYGLFPAHDILPIDLREGCESLGDQLHSWTFNVDMALTPFGDDEMFEMYEYHARAWHQATVIYYYRRIQACDTALLVEEVDRTIDLMAALERFKAECRLSTNNIRAPITWPMFIASCEAIGAARQRCRTWWVRVIQIYNLANMATQWDAVQRIWETLDSTRNTKSGAERQSWIEVLAGLDITLLPM